MRNVIMKLAITSFRHFLNVGMSVNLLIFAALNLPGEVIGSHANEHRVDTDSRLSGASLEHQLWSLVQNRDVDALSELISPMYLGGNTIEFLYHDAEIAKLAHLHINNFSLSNIIESQEDDIRIIAYNFAATGQTSINDRRISVWQRVRHKHHHYFWRLISHSNFSTNY